MNINYKSAVLEGQTKLDLKNHEYKHFAFGFLIFLAFTICINFRR